MFPAALLFVLALFALPSNYTVEWSTYLGGTGTDSVQDLVVGPDGSIYVAGHTASDTFTTVGAYDTTYNGGTNDGYVCKFTPSGARSWCTLIGGAGSELVIGIRVDSTGVYIGGAADAGFPTTSGVLQTTHQGGGRDGFVAKLALDGASLLWSTYFGSSDTVDGLRGIDIDSSGNVYLVTGHTGGTWVSAITPCFLNSNGGGEDTAVARIGGDGQTCSWARYIGGSGTESYAGTVVWHSSGSVYVVSYATSTGLATGGAYDTTLSGTSDYFVAKLAASSGTVTWLTYIGGTGAEETSKHNLAVDSAGNAYVACWVPAGFPTTVGAYDEVTNGGEDMGIAKIASDGASLLASTFVGGSGTEVMEGVVIDRDGNIHISGSSASSNYPVVRGYQAALSGGRDGVYSKLSADLTQLLYSTYLGGTAAGAFSDSFRGVALVSGVIVTLAGDADSTDWPMIAPTFDASHNGGTDIVIVQFGLLRPFRGRGQMSGSAQVK